MSNVGVVRSEGGRISRDINSLSELGKEKGAFQVYWVHFRQILIESLRWDVD